MPRPGEAVGAEAVYVRSSFLLVHRPTLLERRASVSKLQYAIPMRYGVRSAARDKDVGAVSRRFRMNDRTEQTTVTRLRTSCVL